MLTLACTVFGVGIAALVAMLVIAADVTGDERAKLQIEAIKYGLGFFAASGAAAALLLAVRRQRLSEHTHELELLKHAHTEVDATERRVTDLYTKAAEQLGSADAAVRLAGLYDTILSGDAGFEGADFASDVSLEEARALPREGRIDTWPPGWAADTGCLLRAPAG